MLPVLQCTQSGLPCPVTEIRENLTKTFRLSQDERSQMLKSGRVTLFANRVAWALVYLGKAKLLERHGRAIYRITDRGKTLLASNPSSITSKILKQFPEFGQFIGQPQTSDETKLSDNAPIETPEERLERTFQVLRGALTSDLLDSLSRVAPSAFERIVVDLLVAMGYGGSSEDAGQVLGQSHDGGIDGVIKQDKLGLDVVYIQAKRWKDSVGSPEVMKFSGSLTEQHASKGVFLTTSTFSKEAQDYVKGMPQKIVLIDGNLLASLMIDHGVGVLSSKRYEVKRLDEDYFDNL